MKNSKGSIGGFVMGLIILMLMLFATTLTGMLFTDIAQENLDILNMVLIIVGLSSIMVGIRMRSG